LENLTLRQTKVTDAGLVHLRVCERIPEHPKNIDIT
jgi:hypothetical protein